VHGVLRIGKGRNRKGEVDSSVTFDLSLRIPLTLRIALERYVFFRFLAPAFGRELEHFVSDVDVLGTIRV
jgi:hypothetical protein